MTSSAQLQREADAARVGLADTLGQLRDGMAPSALSADVIALVKDSGLSIVKSLAEQARSNPVPALLIGAGLTMLLTRTTGGDVMGVANSALRSAASTGADAAHGAASGVASAVSGAASVAGSAASHAASAASHAASAASNAVKDTAASVAGRATAAASDAAAAMRDRVTGAVDGARQTAAGGYEAAKDKVGATLDAGRRELHDRQDQASALGEEAWQKAEDARHKAESMADQARQSLSRLLEEQPILMAALGAALGAAIGAALPVSQMEKELIGPTGAKALGAGREALSQAADVVRQEAASADIPAKVGAFADKVVQGVTRPN